MPNLTIASHQLRHIDLPSVPESEAETALNIARARTLASVRLLNALETGEALAPAALKLCIDTLKLSVDRSAAPKASTDHAAIAPELQRTLEKILRFAGDAFAAATDPEGSAS